MLRRDLLKGALGLLGLAPITPEKDFADYSRWNNDLKDKQNIDDVFCGDSSLSGTYTPITKNYQVSGILPWFEKNGV
jgi:hypothetical protein